MLLHSCSRPSDIPLPEETPQQTYAIDTLPAAGNALPGVNAAVLDALTGSIESGEYGNIHSIIMIYRDHVIMEEYFRGWTRHMQHVCNSVTKSFLSCLIGIAVEQDLIAGVNEKMLGFFPEYGDISNPDERKQSITLEHLLTMTAGFDMDEQTSMYESTDWIEYMLDLPMKYEPGTAFEYNSGCSHILSGVLEKTTGKTAEAFAGETLFNPLGITHWQWDADPNGVSTGGWGLSLHPVNMAMFGYLFLQQGSWNGKQIVSADWVDVSTSVHTVVMNLHEMIDGKLDYGYHWWRFGDAFLDEYWGGTAPRENDIFYADGYGGQLLYIVPHLQAVVCITAWDPRNPELSRSIIMKCLDAVSGQ